MINKIRTVISAETNPYRNLALEEYLLFHTKEQECILYLWQNKKTVVIGRNQNCFKECKVNYLEEDGGFLARRLSGGGAVFHDLGNLNFTFLVREENYNLDQQFAVILEAVRNSGIEALKTGRNDITADGRKFSGNAFYRSGGFCYHHGTLLVDVDKQMMSKYLNVSRDKLQSKGVASVRSRVVNLTELNPEITVDRMKCHLTEAFEEVYGLKINNRDDQVKEDEYKRLYDKYSDADWRYGTRIPFDYEFSHRFEWGDIQFQLRVEEGVISELRVYSDSLDTEFIKLLTMALKGCAYREAALLEAVNSVTGGSGKMKEDLNILIKRYL